MDVPIDGNVIEFKNFLNKEDCNSLVKEYQKNIDKVVNAKNWRENEIHLNNLEIIKSINEKVSNMFINYDSFIQIDGVKRLVAGDKIVLHDDEYIKENRFGFVIYLNEEFSGGELTYRYPWRNDQDGSTSNFNSSEIRIKPKTGSLIIHDANLYHEVLTVTNGERYMLTGFVKGIRTTLRNKEKINANNGFCFRSIE
ncbi:2OG-Fe(II) oxygenase [bacterium]|nr:2OG-Fe(II) oxygenase [Candidatus Elulimicrobium humile]